jgi:hypothetical protein
MDTAVQQLTGTGRQIVDRRDSSRLAVLQRIQGELRAPERR